MTAKDWRVDDFGYGDAWARARQVATGLLIATARERRLVTYLSGVAEPVKAAVPEVDLTGWPRRTWQLACLLGQIALAEHNAGRPLLAAVAVLKDTGMPPPSGSKAEGSFAGLVRTDCPELLTHSDDSDEAIWSRELARCHSYWTKRATEADRREEA